MKKNRIKTAGIALLAATMLTGVNFEASGQDGRGLGPCGEGFGPGPRVSGVQGYGQGHRINAGRVHHGHYFGPGRRAGQFSQQRALDLTPEQQEQIKALRMEHYKTMKPLKNKMAELKARERTLLSEEKVDMKAMNSNIDEQTSLINKIKKLQVEQKLKMKENLTDEQIMLLERRNPHFGRRGGA